MLVNFYDFPTTYSFLVHIKAVETFSPWWHVVFYWLWWPSFQVKLGEPGYKERYYAEKFEVEASNLIDEIKKDVVSCILSCIQKLFKLPAYKLNPVFSYAH